MNSFWLRQGAAFLFWTTIGLIYSLQVFLVQRPNASLLGALFQMMPFWYLWGLSTPCLAKLNNRLPTHKSFAELLIVRVFLSVVWTLGFVTLYLSIIKSLPTPFPYTGLAAYIQLFPWSYLICLLILGIHIAWNAYEQARRSELDATTLEKKLVEARLSSLQSQLHPHFLFNTLNAISAYVESDPKLARRMMAELGEMLRFSLDRANQQEIPLAEEIDFLKSYLSITQIRFADRLSIRLNIDSELLDARVPSFIVQPLVENAVNHGIASQMVPGTVDISAVRVENKLVLCISDNGIGLPKGWEIAHSKGVGLKNTAARLKQLYPNTHRLDIQSQPGQGTTVCINIPLRTSVRQASVASDLPLSRQQSV